MAARGRSADVVSAGAEKSGWFEGLATRRSAMIRTGRYHVLLGRRWLGPACSEAPRCRSSFQEATARRIARLVEGLCSAVPASWTACAGWWIARRQLARVAPGMRLCAHDLRPMRSGIPNTLLRRHIRPLEATVIWLRAGLGRTEMVVGQGGSLTVSHG